MPKRGQEWALVSAIIMAAALAGCAGPPVTESTEQAPADPHPEASEARTILTPEDVEWREAPPSLPPGARIAVLSGDPAAEGPLTMRAEFPAGYVVPAHTHPSTEHVTILSGMAYLTTGGSDERTDVAELPAGSYFAMPPGTIHEFRAGDEVVVLQIHSTAPWRIDYVDPADDPRNE